MGLTVDNSSNEPFKKPSNNNRVKNDNKPIVISWEEYFDEKRIETLNLNDYSELGPVKKSEPEKQTPKVITWEQYFEEKEVETLNLNDYEEFK